jgi:hypothetical protein
MDNIILFVKKLFRSIEPKFLIRSYLISVAMLYISYKTFVVSFGSAVFVVVNAILFPFAYLVWNELVLLIMGNNVLYLNTLIMAVWKFLKIVCIFMFTIFIAPIGILYIYIRTSLMQRKNY